MARKERLAELTGRPSRIGGSLPGAAWKRNDNEGKVVTKSISTCMQRQSGRQRRRGFCQTRRAKQQRWRGEVRKQMKRWATLEAAESSLSMPDSISNSSFA